MAQKKTKPANYLAQVREQMNLVIWPTRAETIKLTGVVIAVSILTGFYLGGLDYLFTYIMQFVL